MTDIFGQDFRYAVRTLRKSPLFAVVAVLTLALGIGANTAIFSVVESVLLRSLPYTHPESLVQISNTYLPAWPELGLSGGDFQDWKRQAKTFVAMEAYADLNTGYNLTGDGDPQRIRANYASAGLFPLLGVPPAAGRAFYSEEDQPGSAPIVLLSHRFWQSRYGLDPAVINRTVQLDGQSYTIAGALPANFPLLPESDVWMPLGQYQDDLTQRVHHPLNVIARLRPGATLEQAQSELSALNSQVASGFPDTHKGWGVFARLLEDPAAAKLRRTLLVLLGAVGLVLLIACSNIANLLLARNAVREREVALRTALGASPYRLLGQMLTESLILALAGGLLGSVFAGVGLKILRAFLPASLSAVRETSLNQTVLLFTFGLCLLCGLLCGLLPALHALKADLNSLLKQGSRSSASARRLSLHSALIVSEIAFALIPLIGAGLLLRSFYQLLNVNPGFATDHILTMTVSQPSLSLVGAIKLTNEQQTELIERQSIQFEDVAMRLKGLPGVKAVAGIDVLPLASSNNQASRFLVEGEPVPEAGARPVAQIRTASLGYFSAMNIPLWRGRLFRSADWVSSNIIVNEAMARRFWPHGDPIGKRINLCSLAAQPCWSSIVGVIGDVHQFGLDAPPTFDVYGAGGWTPVVIIRTASDPETIAAAARDIVHRAAPTLPVSEVTTMDELVSTSVSPRRFVVLLIGIFASLALLLAAVGTYGVMSFTVSQRTQEIGVRVALGAQHADVGRLVLGHAMRLTLVGIVAGFLGALALARFLSTLLYGVRAYDPITFLAVAALLAAVALAASYIPVRRAMRVDPVVALRAD